MANENLKDALRTAGLTSEQFAQIIDVDPKTVQRWVSGRTPYPRHRATIARALDLTEHELWPDDVPPAAALPSPGQPAQSGDVIGSWGKPTDPGAPDLVAFITNAVDQVDLLDDGRGLVGMPGLIDALLAHSHGGCQIRVLTPSPSSELAPLIGRDQIELRVFKAPAGTTLIRAGDQLLLTLSIPTATGRSPALLQLHRQSDGGLFDRFADYYQLLWDHAPETLSDLEQLDAYLLDKDQTPSTHHDTSPTAVEPSEPTEQSNEPASPLSPEQTPRRWPRRPS